MADLSRAILVLTAPRPPKLPPLQAAGWDESEHPRHPEGVSEGGQFKSLGEAVGELAKDMSTSNPNAAMHLKDGDVFKFAGEDPGGLESIQWFKAEQRENGLYAVEIDGDNVFPLSGVIDKVEKAEEVPGVAGPLEPVFPDSASASENSSSHDLYEVTIDGEKWFVKSVEKTQEVVQLRDYVEPGRDLERELAAQIVAEEILEGTPELKLDLRVAEVKEGNIAGLGHVIMSKAVEGDPGDGSGWRERPDMFLNHSELSLGEARALSLYDFVIGNTDRHTGNLVRAPGGRAVAIDNGLAFPSANSDVFGRYHVLEFHEKGGMQVHNDGSYQTSDTNIGDLHWPDTKQFNAVGHLQENWERIDKRLEPYLLPIERKAMWRRVEYLANGQGRFPTANEWRQGTVDETIRGHGWHESVTLGRDEEANAAKDRYGLEPANPFPDDEEDE